MSFVNITKLKNIFLKDGKTLHPPLLFLNKGKFRSIPSKKINRLLPFLFEGGGDSYKLFLWNSQKMDNKEKKLFFSKLACSQSNSFLKSSHFFIIVKNQDVKYGEKGLKKFFGHSLLTGALTSFKVTSHSGETVLAANSRSEYKLGSLETKTIQPFEYEPVKKRLSLFSRRSKQKMFRSYRRPILRRFLFKSPAFAKTEGILYIHFSANNIFATLTNPAGEPKAHYSGGRVTARKKGAYAAQQVAGWVGRKARRLRFKKLGLVFRGRNKNRNKNRKKVYSVLKNLPGIQLQGIFSLDPRAHNGCRPKLRPRTRKMRNA